MVKIYTKKGDRGDTSLFDGAKVRKTNDRVAAYGAVDELNAFIGVARSALPEGAGDVARALDTVQGDLFALGALLADPRRDAEAALPGDERLALGPAQVEWLERRIDEWQEELPPLRTFILPGGHAASADLHVARVVARRAERAVVELVDAGRGSPFAIEYLNRLSDFLFVAARMANHRAGLADVPWG